MDGTMERTQDPIEKQFHEGVATPSDPSEFLLKILGRTKDDPYVSYPEDQIPEGETLDTLRAKLPERRERMQSAFVRIHEIAHAVIQSYKKECEENGLNPGKVSFYVIGGRIRAKALQHSSDIDVVLTIEHSGQGLDPVYSQDSSETIMKKIDIRKKYTKKLEALLDALSLLEKDANGETEGWFLEPKGYGVADDMARTQWAEMARTSGSARSAVRIAVE